MIERESVVTTHGLGQRMEAGTLETSAREKSTSIYRRLDGAINRSFRNAVSPDRIMKPSESR